MRYRNAILLAAVILSSACSKQLDDNNSCTLTVRAVEAGCNPSNQFLTIKAGGEWKLALAFSDQTEYDFVPWAYFGKYSDVDSITLSGKGDNNLVQFNWSGNKSP